MEAIIKILELKTENFARLKAVAIRPDTEAPVVQITGENQNGKTSVLRAIWTALQGKAVAPAVPIHKGAEQARIRLTLGTDEGVEATVTRSFAYGPTGDEYTSELKVELAGGKPVRVKPQALIDSWLGAITIDPLQFARAKPKEQFDALKGMVKGFDFEENTKARKAAFDKRTDVNRDAKQQRTLADKIVIPPGKVPAKEPDVSALAQQLEEALDHNSGIETRKARRAQARAEADGLMDQAEQLRARAATLEQQAKDIDAKLDAAEALPEPIDTTEISAKMANASADQRVWTAVLQRKQHEAAATAAESEATELSLEIDNLDAEKVEAIGAAKLPVPGLGLGDDMVLLNGLPFEQAGTAEKLRASIAIGMADDPTLRIMLVDEGSELDGKSMAIVREMASAADFQIWVARIEEDGKTGFVIVDGEVRA